MVSLSLSFESFLKLQRKQGDLLLGEDTDTRYWNTNTRIEKEEKQLQFKPVG